MRLKLRPHGGMCILYYIIITTYISAQWRWRGGPSRVTPFRGWRLNENQKFFATEFTKTLYKRSPGKAERVRVVTVVC